MTSPTELSDNILDALTSRYGSDLKAEVFTDDQANQILYLKFIDGERYSLRIEAREALADDPSQHQDFSDPHTGAHARITEDELVIFTSTSTPTQYRSPSVEYPLERIDWVRTLSLPGGQAAVAMGVAGQPKSPGLTFSHPPTAVAFQHALEDASNFKRRGL